MVINLLATNRVCFQRRFHLLVGEASFHHQPLPAQLLVSLLTTISSCCSQSGVRRACLQRCPLPASACSPPTANTQPTLSLLLAEPVQPFQTLACCQQSISPAKPAFTSLNLSIF